MPTVSGHIVVGNQVPTMATESYIDSDSMQDFAPRAVGRPEAELMDMARDGLFHLNRLALALIKGKPEAAGEGYTLPKLSEHICSATAAFRVAQASPDGAQSATALLHLIRVIAYFDLIPGKNAKPLFVVRNFLQQVGADLKQPASAKPDELRSKLESVRSEVDTYLERYLTRLLDREERASCHAKETVLYHETLGSQEWREMKAAQFNQLGNLLLDTFSRQSRCRPLEDLFSRTYASVQTLSLSVSDSFKFEEALEDVLIAAVKLRKAGLTDGSLDGIIEESVVALVAAHAGCDAQLADAWESRVGTKWLFGTSRRESERALVAAFRDTYPLREAAKLVSKYFDVNVLSRKETVQKKLDSLHEEALKKMRYIYSSHGREVADAYEQSLERNLWVVEGESFGISWADFREKLLAIQQEVCWAELSYLFKQDCGNIADGDEAAEKYLASLQKNPWVVEGARFGIPLAKLLKKIRRDYEDALERNRRPWFQYR